MKRPMRAAAASLLAIAAVAPGTSGGGVQTPHFVEEAVVAGINHAYAGDFAFFVGGGVAVFDCNADGKPDLYLAGGSDPAALYRNESLVGGALRFSRLGDAATDLTDVTGAYPLDIDADRVVDLAVLRNGENVLLRGLGNCRFERANEAWGFDGGDAWTTAFSATWEGSAVLPTLAIGNYVNNDSEDPARLCLDNDLVRPDPASGAYAPATPLAPGWCALSMLFSDWDRSGRRDLRITNDRHYYGDRQGEEQLWRIADGVPPGLYTREDGWQPLRIWGMGIASYDLTGDGYPEVYLTSQGDNKLQTLARGPGQPRYRDIALKRGVTATTPSFGKDTRMPSTAWHAEFQDVNNDGQIDLFVAKGNIDAMPDFALDDPSNLFLGKPDGTFADGAQEAGILDAARTRGAALTDLNLDGLLDLVEVSRSENVRLWRNVGSGDAARPAPMGGWLGLMLDQPGPNHDAIGAWIEVKTGSRTTRREVTVGGGHAGGQIGWIHFGLGRAQDAQVRVQWPDGEWGPWQPVAANGFAVVERGAAELSPWLPLQG